jgi:hypothetical protein
LACPFLPQHFLGKASDFTTGYDLAALRAAQIPPVQTNIDLTLAFSLKASSFSFIKQCSPERGLMPPVC